MKNYRNVAGNFEPKYQAKNPISKILVKGFTSSLKQLLNQISQVNINIIAELGAGEGHLTQHIVDQFPKADIFVSDVEPSMINTADNKFKKYSNIKISQQDIAKTSYKSNYFDLVVVCEVLEHLPDPKKALIELKRILKPQGFGIFSVPNEPIWRILNLARGKYINELGNTPGHINHYSSQQFADLITKSGFKILTINKPLPWTMLLAKMET